MQRSQQQMRLWDSGEFPHYFLDGLTKPYFVYFFILYLGFDLMRVSESLASNCCAKVHMLALHSPADQSAEQHL